MHFCAETQSFWYMSLHCWEEMIFQPWVWGDSHNKSVTWWKERNNLWGLVLWEEQGSPSLSVGGGICSEEPWMTGRRCGGDSSEGTSLLLQTATVQGDRAVRWRCSVGERGMEGTTFLLVLGWRGHYPQEGGKSHLPSALWFRSLRPEFVRWCGHSTQTEEGSRTWFGARLSLMPHSDLAQGKNNESLQVTFSQSLCWLRTHLDQVTLDSSTFVVSIPSQMSWEGQSSGFDLAHGNPDLSLRGPAKP